MIDTEYQKDYRDPLDLTPETSYGSADEVPPSDEKKSANPIKKNKGLLLVGGLLVFGLLAFGIYRAAQVNNERLPSENQISDVTDNPDEHYNQVVTVTGTINSVLGSRAFVLDAPGVGFGGDDLLVISRYPIEPIGGGFADGLFDVNDRVSVRGTVKALDIRQVEQELGSDLVDESFTAWQGKPVIIADSVDNEL